MGVRCLLHDLCLLIDAVIFLIYVLPECCYIYVFSFTVPSRYKSALSHTSFHYTQSFLFSISYLKALAVVWIMKVKKLQIARFRYGGMDEM